MAGFPATLSSPEADSERRPIMTTSIETKPKRYTSPKWLAVMVFGVAVTFGSFAVGTAHAADRDRDGGRGHAVRQDRGDRDGHGGGGWGGGYVYAPPPVIYVDPSYGYDYPPPPVVYGYQPGFGVNITIP